MFLQKFIVVLDLYGALILRKAKRAQGKCPTALTKFPMPGCKAGQYFFLRKLHFLVSTIREQVLGFYFQGCRVLFFITLRNLSILITLKVSKFPADTFVTKTFFFLVFFWVFRGLFLGFQRLKKCIFFLNVSAGNYTFCDLDAHREFPDGVFQCMSCNLAYINMYYCTKVQVHEAHAYKTYCSN